MVVDVTANSFYPFFVVFFSIHFITQFRNQSYDIFEYQRTLD
ncbi:unnamed protein product [Moritella viscosa]|nr:unnamed protein product [Moritella viscosa]